VVGGAAALLLQQRPDLDPDQTKALLALGAQPISGVSPAAQGAGLLNVSRSLARPTPHVGRPHLAPASGLVRALMPALSAQMGEGDLDADHVLWDHVLWDHVLWDHVLWDHVLWDHVLWDHVLWDHVLWDHVLWDHVLWDHVLWDHVLSDQTVFD
jgi:serine protease AprX